MTLGIGPARPAPRFGGQTTFRAAAIFLPVAPGHAFETVVDDLDDTSIGALVGPEQL